MWAEFTQIRANLREFIRVRGEQSFAKPSAQITTLRTSIILRMYFHVFDILTSRSIFEIFAWIIKGVFYGKHQFFSQSRIRLYYLTIFHVLNSTVYNTVYISMVVTVYSYTLTQFFASPAHAPAFFTFVISPSPIINLTVP